MKMELWIRSQDKKKLVNNCNLYMSDEMRGAYTIEDLNNKYLKLGTYKTKERALEVLNEIQNHMMKSMFAKKVNGLGEEVDLIPIPILVYEMPKE